MNAWGDDREANKNDANDKAVRFANELSFEDVTVWEARRTLQAALADSRWEETSTESDEFCSYKLAAIRRDVAYSWEATRCE